MGPFDATVATALAAFPPDVRSAAFPLDGLIGTVAGPDHVVVDVGIGVTVGIVVVALYVVFLRWAREEEAESRTEATRGERQDT